MPNGSHHQSGQHRRCISPTPARALACAKHSLDPGACLIDGAFDFSSIFVRVVHGVTIALAPGPAKTDIEDALMILGDLHRWLYRGKRPNWIAKILNRAWAAVFSTGVASNFLVTLEVTGRKSGRPISYAVFCLKKKKKR